MPKSTLTLHHIDPSTWEVKKTIGSFPRGDRLYEGSLNVDSGVYYFIRSEKKTQDTILQGMHIDTGELTEPVQCEDLPNSTEIHFLMYDTITENHFTIARDNDTNERWYVGVLDVTDCTTTMVQKGGYLDNSEKSIPYAAAIDQQTRDMIILFSPPYDPSQSDNNWFVVLADLQSGAVETIFSNKNPDIGYYMISNLVPMNNVQLNPDADASMLITKRVSQN
jgi:hypothetical protein